MTLHKQHCPEKLLCLADTKLCVKNSKQFSSFADCQPLPQPLSSVGITDDDIFNVTNLEIIACISINAAGDICIWDATQPRHTCNSSKAYLATLSENLVLNQQSSTCNNSLLIYVCKNVITKHLIVELQVSQKISSTVPALWCAVQPFHSIPSSTTM